VKNSTTQAILTLLFVIFTNKNEKTWNDNIQCDEK